MSEWLDNIKEHEKIFVVNRHGERLARVERLTKTQILVTGTTSRYKRLNGAEIGADRWGGSWLEEFTEERLIALKRRINRRNHIAAVKKIVIEDLTIDQLKQILTIVSPN